MKTPQIAPLAGMTPLGMRKNIHGYLVPSVETMLNSRSVDEKTVAERQWQKPKLAPAPQKVCDIGLFSDEANQLDLVEMFQEPTNGE